MHRTEVDLNTGDVRVVQLTPEEVAALSTGEPPFTWPVLSAKQFMWQLRRDGTLAAAQGAINLLAEPLRTDAQLAFDRCPNFEHDDPLLMSLAPAVGYDTPEKLKAFFIAASQL